MTFEEYLRVKLQKEGATPDEIETIVAHTRKEFGPAHLAQTMPRAAADYVDKFCDHFRDASIETLTRLECELVENRRKLTESN